MGEQPSAVEPLVEGMESQALRFRLDDSWFVLRINRALRGFQKDAWAASAVGHSLPVPRVMSLGEADESHAYCISEWLPGTTLEDLPVEQVATLAGDWFVRHLQPAGSAARG